MAHEVPVSLLSAALFMACQQAPGNAEVDDRDGGSAMERAAADISGAQQGSEGHAADGQEGPMDDGRDPRAPNEALAGTSTSGVQEEPSALPDPDATKPPPIAPVDVRLLDGALHVTCATCAEASGSDALPYRRFRITVTGDDYVRTELRELHAATHVALVPSDGSPLADGLYEYEVHPEVELAAGHEGTAGDPIDAVGRNARDPAVAERMNLPAISKETGAFSVVAGALVDPTAAEPPTQE